MVFSGGLGSCFFVERFEGTLPMREDITWKVFSPARVGIFFLGIIDLKNISPFVPGLDVLIFMFPSKEGV